MAESTQHKLDRIRPPRVQITYDVEIGGAIQKKELPLVVGIMADLSGIPEKPLPRVKDRKFVEIDRDNFSDVMASIAPHLTMRVDNKLQNDGSSMGVELRFQTMDDFGPISIIQQVPTLKKLYDARGRLNDLIAKLDGNDDLDAKLQEIIKDTESLKKIKSEGAIANA
jgi:type VI secretion system protein ImpB